MNLKIGTFWVPIFFFGGKVVFKFFFEVTVRLNEAIFTVVQEQVKIINIVHTLNGQSGSSTRMNINMHHSLPLLGAVARLIAAGHADDSGGEEFWLRMEDYV